MHECGMILTGEHQRTWRYICPGATLPTTKLTLTGLSEVRPAARDRRLTARDMALSACWRIEGHSSDKVGPNNGKYVRFTTAPCREFAVFNIRGKSKAYEGVGV